MTDIPRTIHFISLGCAKNRVDSEVMAGIAHANGLDIVAEPEQADVLVVNTCSFIESAREESIEVLLEMGALAQEGEKRLIAAGCMAQQFSEELKKEMPEIDHLIGTAHIDELGALIDGTAQTIEITPSSHFLQKANTPRFIAPGTLSTYVKIADGCTRKCAFCAIPSIRGTARSRPLDDIVGEAEWLVSKGVKELNLVAQDTSAYGRDLQNGTDLTRLIRELNNVSGIHWIRLLYLYPDAVSVSLLKTIAESERVVPYLDIPIQHASDGMLKRMRRGHRAKDLKELIRKIRHLIPGAFLRTTVLVGHPGETAQDFDELLAFVEWARFDHLGAFRYSDEPGTASFGASDPVSNRTSYNRFRKVMALQRRVGRQKHRDLMGQTLNVIVEDTADDEGYVLAGRHSGQAPEIDGVTYLVSSSAKPGDIVRATVVQTGDYDIVAEQENENGRD